MRIERINLPTVDSTNTWVAQNAARLEAPVVVTATEQSAGRGQRGNSWESEPGKNLTMTMLWRPSEFRARRQFAISECVALGCVDALRGFGIEARVKWPNDIYVGDRKIAGILIEHSVAGMNIEHTIIGLGLNVNQREFVSNAPNPVSMWQLLGGETDVEQVLDRVVDAIMTRLDRVADEEWSAAQHTEYHDRLWRIGALHGYALPDGTTFRGAIIGVDTDGLLTIVDPAAGPRRFAFKEVSFIL